MGWALSQKKKFFVVSCVCKWADCVVCIKLVLYYAVRFGLDRFLKLEPKTEPNRRKNRTKNRIHPNFVILIDFQVGLD